MAQAQYCTTSDVYRFCAPGMLQVAARLVASVSTSSDALTLQGHGLATGDPIALRAESGGSLPSPLTAATTYYAIAVSPDVFQVATTPTGSAVNLTTAGSNVLLVPQMPWSRWIDECSAMTDQTVPAHAAPLVADDGTTPEPIRVFTAAQVAMRALAFCGRETEAIQAQLAYWGKLADKWARGVPLRGASRPVPTNVALSRSGSGADPRGWSRGNGRFP